MIDVKIVGLDHVVFNVADPERSLQFYGEVLGLPAERVDDYRAGKVPFASVRVNGGTILDFFPPGFSKVERRGNNVNHIALTLANTPDEIRGFLSERGVEIVREMTGNFGAQGDSAHAFQILDPDGNLLELNAYE